MEARVVARRGLVILIITSGVLPLLYSMYITTYYEAIRWHRSSLTSISNKQITRASSSGQKEILYDNISRTHTEVGERFERRLQRLKQACLLYANSSMFRPVSKKPSRSIVGPYWPLMNVSVGYCSIQKTGSTTWYGIFKSIRKKMKELGVREYQDSNLAKRIMFLFVHDPYFRLMSAYMDKLYCPNTSFWGLGRLIVRKFRHNPTNHSWHCGHDVTFPEFIKYVIYTQETGKLRDGHFVPTHDHCALCNVSYDYIGHLDTFRQDMDYLLKVMESPVNYTQNFDNHTIYDNAKWVLGGRTSEIRKCMSMREACLRLWKKWHVRGIISKTEPLPLTAEQAEVISQQGFVNLSLQALARSGPKWQRKLQKKEALRQAFAAVPMEDKLKLQKLLFLDFELFGFDPSPEAVFPKTSAGPPNSGSYRYFDLGI